MTALDTGDGRAMRRKVPPTPRTAVRKLVSTATTGLLLVSLPVFVPYNILRYYIVGPPVPWMTLKSMLISRLLKLFMGMTMSIYIPPVDPQEWEIIPPRMEKQCREGVEISLVRLQPVDDCMRIGIAAVPLIKAEERSTLR